jgi:hypothetical protein
VTGPVGLPATQPASGDTSTADLVEAIACRVVELLLEGPPTTPTGRLIDAAEVARRFSVDRGWVYQHADELHAVRLGDGPKARLRFDVAKVADALLTRSAPQEAPPARRGRRRSESTGGAAPLLPIRGEA